MAVVARIDDAAVMPATKKDRRAGDVEAQAVLLLSVSDAVDGTTAPTSCEGTSADGQKALTRAGKTANTAIVWRTCII
eukprot:CAMPEP_0178578006 /NCGR_PEP_ID=MMETSP0697-20121206/21312_1 /TAXON_ID=265572 /ORGANISM="Extubocellulus spinifer, Strain CCMP396" /LENGTH=77 /DNA_ID=CAMNT_0020213345 /DNA_START=541 /DNA_END=771 /DNA_ORIENTATION=+